MICVDPQAYFLIKIQSILIDFFWYKLHWLQKHALYLSKDERGHGLVHLQSRIAAFRIQFIQRLLKGSEDANWRIVTFSVLKDFDGLGLDKVLLWMDPQKVKLSKFPVFYQNLFKVWALIEVQNKRTLNSLYWLLQEPLFFGSRLDLSKEMGYSVIEEDLLNSGISTIGHVQHIAGTDFKDLNSMTERLGVRSTQLVARVLDKWRSALSENELKLFTDYSLGSIYADCRSYKKWQFILQERRKWIKVYVIVWKQCFVIL